MKTIVFAVAIMMCASMTYAQVGNFTPYEKGILDLWYLRTNSSINGELIVDGTISTGKLDFAVVDFGDWTNHLQDFGDHTLVFTNHTNEASAHHTRFANSEETDQIFANWLATNAYMKIGVAGEVIIPVNGWTSPVIATASWAVVDGWTNIHAGHFVDLSKTCLTVNLPAGITSHVKIISTISADSSANVDAEYAFFVNGERTHTNLGAFGIVRSHGGVGSIGSITVAEDHDLINGDQVDVRVRRWQGAAGNPQITAIGGSFSIRGWVE